MASGRTGTARVPVSAMPVFRSPRGAARILPSTSVTREGQTYGSRVAVCNSAWRKGSNHSCDCAAGIHAVVACGSDHRHGRCFVCVASLIRCTTRPSLRKPRFTTTIAASGRTSRDDVAAGFNLSPCHRRAWRQCGSARSFATGSFLQARLPVQHHRHRRRRLPH